MNLQHSVGWGATGAQRLWVERLARLGLATKGIVYLFVGGLAAMAATGNGGRLTGSEGAVRTIGSQPFGQILLVLTAVGLFGYALWQLVNALGNPEHESMLERAGHAASCVLHVALGIAAIQMIDGVGGGDHRTWVSTLMGSDLGRGLLVLVGVGIMGAGVHQLVKARTTEFTRQLAMGQMSYSERKWAVRLGRMGHAARGVVFPIIGYFLIRAALDANPAEAQGMGGALREVGQSPLGEAALFVVAIGLAAYGVFMLLLARYRNIHVHGL